MYLLNSIVVYLPLLKNIFSEKLYCDNFDNKTENGEIGTANSYKDSLSSFKKFWKSDYLSIEDVDVKFLKKYEKWMLETRGNSVTTVGIYLRNLRTVFNLIINHDKSKFENYPFTEKKYIIPTAENEKISLEWDFGLKMLSG